jgi:hypothetical protein
MYQSPTYAVESKDIILQNLRLSNEIRNGVTKIYKSIEILPNKLTHLMMARLGRNMLYEI